MFSHLSYLIPVLMGSKLTYANKSYSTLRYIYFEVVKVPYLTIAVPLRNLKM